MHALGVFLNARRVFFYDAQKDEKGNEPALPVQQWIDRQLSSVRATEGFLLRLGTYSRSRRPQQKPEQKEVDVLLAVDLLVNSFNRNMEEAAILTGDLDLRPVVEEVVRHGTIVHLIYDESGVSPALLDAVDKRQAIRSFEYERWLPAEFTRTHPIPSEQLLSSEMVQQLSQVSTEVSRHEIGPYKDVPLLRNESPGAEKPMSILIEPEARQGSEEKFETSQITTDNNECIPVCKNRTLQALSLEPGRFRPRAFLLLVAGSGNRRYT